MANIVQFSIDDTSPTISYDPLGDTLSLPNLNAGWNPFFTGSGFASQQGAVGNGTSFHITARDGARLSVTWRGTSIQLQGYVTNANYTIEVDGEPLERPQSNLAENVLATIQGLENTLHTVALTARIPPDRNPPESMVRFDNAIVASRPLNLNSTTPNNIYTLRTLNSESVAFHGRWSFITQDNITSHQSSNVGDQVVARFRGTAFVLRGTTSPDSGRYTITLNNETTSLSAKSSFLSRDSLLYYSTALEPNATHTITITNEGGGSLSLMESGFRAYAIDSPDPDPTSTPPPPPIIVSAPSSINKGTIAAFALAGILACAMLSGLLYYFFIYRSRRQFKREREMWRRQLVQSTVDAPHNNDKVAEANDSVLDIARRSSSSGDPGIEERNLGLQLGFDDPQHRDGRRHSERTKTSGARRQSEKSSFARWKREVETAVARESLGIRFRHSGDTNEKRHAYQGTMESESDPLSSSSRSNSSPGFRASMMIRKAGFKGGKNKATRTGNGHGKAERRPPSQEKMLSDAHAASTLGSLSYLTAPNQGGHQGEPSDNYMLAPPSYAASVMSKGDGGQSSPLSVPRSVGQSSYPTSTVFNSQNNLKGKRKSDDPLNSGSDNNRASGGRLTSPLTDQGSLTSEITPPFAIRELSKEDRGSIYDHSIDEDPKVLGGSAVRQVIRSLSPRTSRASFFPRRSFHQGQSRRETSSSLEMEPIHPISERPESSVPVQSLVSPLVAPSPRESRPLPKIPQSPDSGPRPPPVQQTAARQTSHDTQKTHDQSPQSQREPSHAQASARSGTDEGTWISSRLPSTHFSYSSSSKLGASSLAPNSASTGSQAHGFPARYSISRPLRQSSDPTQASRNPFRLTPASFIPFPHQDTPPQRPSPSASETAAELSQAQAIIADHIRDSFIDFTVSSDVSIISNNGYTDTSSAQDVRRYSTPLQAIPSLPEQRSRWSSSNSAGISTQMSGQSPVDAGNKAGNEGVTVTPGGYDPKNASGAESSSSGSFGKVRSARPTVPAQISIPSHTQFLSPHRQMRLSTSDASSRSDPVHVHPQLENLESPTESLPLSASDLNFHYSDSEEMPTSPRAPGRSRVYIDRESLPMSPFNAVPPSPSTREDEPIPQTPLPTGLSSPNYIVQRVLGLNSPASSVTARPPQPHHSRSRSGSTSAFFTTPLSSRFEQSTSSLGRGSDPDIPRTM